MRFQFKIRANTISDNLRYNKYERELLGVKHHES
jgi:hypothetical protein